MSAAPEIPAHSRSMTLRRFLFTLFVSVSAALPAKDAGDAPGGIRAASYIVVDANSGVPLLERNADDSRAVASTQKIITALVVVDHGDLERRVKILESDIDVEPTRLGIRPGDTYTVRELLYAFLVKSANDEIGRAHV